MVTCPLEGCEYSPPPDAPNPVGSIMAHASSKTDKIHKGVSGQRVRAMLEAQGADVDASSDTGGPRESTDGGADPAKDGPPSTGSSGGDGGAPTPSSGGGGCPECDGDLNAGIAGNFYQEEGADDGEYVRAEEGDGLCADCGILVTGDGTAVPLEAQ